MEIKVRAFGIAKDILGFREQTLSVENGETILEFKKRLLSQYPKFEDLVSLAFAVNEEYCSEDFVLQPLDEVVIIPPVSGG